MTASLGLTAQKNTPYSNVTRHGTLAEMVAKKPKKSYMKESRELRQPTRGSDPIGSQCRRGYCNSCCKNRCACPCHKRENLR